MDRLIAALFEFATFPTAALSRRFFLQIFPGRQEIGAALLDGISRGEEIVVHVDGIGRAGRFEIDAMLARDVGEAAGYVCPSGEDYAFDLRADRRQCRAGLVAAIEDGRAAGVGHGLACCLDQGPEPAGTRVSAGFASAQQDDRAICPRGGPQRANRMGERVDDDCEGIALGGGYCRCSSIRVTRSSIARKRSTTRAF